MQTYAKDKNDNRIFVELADKGTDYFCFECHERVRARGGFLTKLHFYHINPQGMCRHVGKSSEHIAVQCFIQNQLGIESCEQEVYFGKIQRIGDLAWHPRKIIFEIQCSPITADEIDKRNRDYESLGWSVIWILHDKTFNQRRASFSEYWLANHCHYFTNIGHDGGSIYDLASIISKGKRVIFGQQTIDITAIQEHSVCNDAYFLQHKRLLLPNFLQKRVESWQYFVRNDFLFQALEDISNIQILRQKEEKFLKPQKEPREVFSLGKQIGGFFKNIWLRLLKKAI